MHSIYDYSLPLENGEQLSLSKFQDQVILIVNTHQECDLSPQLSELNQLQQQFKEHKFTIIALPCEQFICEQKNATINQSLICLPSSTLNFATVKVNGPDALPLFNFLRNQCRGLKGSRAIKWNFTKFLVNRQGEVVNRYAPRTRPTSFSHVIESLL